MKGKFLFTFLIICVFFFVVFAEEDEKDKAIEKAIEEAAITVDQLSFEKQEIISAHFEKGEKLFFEGKLDSAEKEFKAVLEIIPDEKKALSFLKSIKQKRESLKKKEEKQKDKEEKETLIKKKKEKKKALAGIESQKKTEKRQVKRGKRKKARTREEEIDEHMRLGKEYYAQEKYEDAVEEWNKVLGRTSQTNKNHQRALQWIDSAKRSEQQKREKESLKKKEEFEEKVLLDVERAWSVKEPSAGRKEEKEEEVEEKVSAAKLKLEEKARQLVSLDFENAHLRTVLTFLWKVSGVNIVLDESVFPAEVESEEEPAIGAEPAVEAAGEEEIIPEAETSTDEEEDEEEEEKVSRSLSARVTIRLKNIPLIEALDVILRTKGLNYRIEENIIWITTEENLAAGELVTRSYKPSGGIGDIVDMLRSTVPVEGGEIEGPAGSKITVDRTSGIIFITNTEMNHRLAEDLIRRLQTVPPQVSIETRFMDVDMDTLARVGFQWNITNPIKGLSNDSYIGGHDFTGSMPDTGPGMDIGVSQTDLLGDTSGGVFMKFTKLTQTQFEAILQAFEGSEKTNLLSAPQITAINNYEASIELATRYPYVESYSVETETFEMLGSVSLNGGWVVGDVEYKESSIIPSDIVRRDVGVTLKVTPGIGADRKTINLTLTPEVVDLVDWLVYETSTRYTIKMPIFSVRYLSTNVDINDGETLVLGGLIKSEERESTESIPFLGRIPILGSLFRRKSTTSEKRELLIFVTARILEPSGQPLIRD